jgi:hypothetical protein
MACVAEELQSQQGPHRAPRRDHFRPGESCPREDRVEVGGDEQGQEKEKAAELGAEAGGRQVELADVGHISGDGTGLVGPLDIEASWQFREALFLQDGGDRRWAERFVLAGKAMADVVDGEILFPECDNALAQPLLLTWWPALPCG